MADVICTTTNRPWRLSDGSFLLMGDAPAASKDLTIDGGHTAITGWSLGRTFTLTRVANSPAYYCKLYDGNQYAECYIGLQVSNGVWAWKGYIRLNTNNIPPHYDTLYYLTISLSVTPPDVTTDATFTIVTESNHNSLFYDDINTVTMTNS